MNSQTQKLDEQSTEIEKQSRKIDLLIQNMELQSQEIKFLIEENKKIKDIVLQINDSFSSMVNHSMF